MIACDRFEMIKIYDHETAIRQLATNTITTSGE
jgi:hypothetical protein